MEESSWRKSTQTKSQVCLPVAAQAPLPVQGDQGGNSDPDNLQCPGKKGDDGLIWSKLGAGRTTSGEAVADSTTLGRLERSQMNTWDLLLPDRVKFVICDWFSALFTFHDCGCAQRTEVFSTLLC